MCPTSTSKHYSFNREKPDFLEESSHDAGPWEARECLDLNLEIAIATMLTMAATELSSGMTHSAVKNTELPLVQATGESGHSVTTTCQ